MQFEDPLARYYFERYILDICITTLERGGVTSKLDTYQFLSDIDAWGIPKYPDKTVILPPGANLPHEITAFICANEHDLKEPNCWLGTWIDPRTGHCYLDISTICYGLEEAMRAVSTLSQTAQRRIAALYNFKHEQVLYL
jgi:hypothetical protein